MAISTSSIIINATKQKVWEAITRPELVKQWQYGSDLITTWKAGNPIRFVTKWEENVYEQWGTVLEFKPVEKLRYSLFAPRPGVEDKSENYFEMIYSLTENDGQTKLEITQQDNRPNTVHEETPEEENTVLITLKKLVEQGK